MSLPAPLIEARNLEVGYPIPGNGIFAKSRILPIVHDTNLSLDAGRTLGVVGESGCGAGFLR